MFQVCSQVYAQDQSEVRPLELWFNTHLNVFTGVFTDMCAQDQNKVMTS